MGANENYASMSAASLRGEVEDLFARYDNLLNKCEYEKWLEMFAVDALYRIVPRENFELGLPLAAWHCESRAMIEDRIYAIRKTLMYAPRYVRRFGSGIVVDGWKDGLLKVESSYLATETLLDEVTKVFNAGHRYDELTNENGVLKFKSRVVVYDTILIPNSLIFPL
jgi:salicylate 5-hydroxylase small subunit